MLLYIFILFFLVFFLLPLYCKSYTKYPVIYKLTNKLHKLVAFGLPNPVAISYPVPVL